MKTTSFNSESSSIWTSLKSAFLVFQVVVIALAIPVLSYLQMSYDTKPSQEKSSGIIKKIEIKENTVAFNQ
jgi:hypothetical protein